jgi:hypothetical protein
VFQYRVKQLERSIGDSDVEPWLTARAGKLLGRPEATRQSLPVIDSSLRGLQIVLVPMYVGVTEADIYTGETNYAFTSGWRQGEFAAAISSYARMKSAASSEQYESRKRLIERIAKELVPATLQQLGIPRPIDPADPYSYSDGVDRVSQKTLTLSAPTRAALDRFRGGPWQTRLGAHLGWMRSLPLERDLSAQNKWRIRLPWSAIHVT